MNHMETAISLLNTDHLQRPPVGVISKEKESRLRVTTPGQAVYQPTMLDDVSDPFLAEPVPSRRPGPI